MCQLCGDKIKVRPGFSLVPLVVRRIGLGKQAEGDYYRGLFPVVSCSKPGREVDVTPLAVQACENSLDLDIFDSGLWYIGLDISLYCRQIRLSGMSWLGCLSSKFGASCRILESPPTRLIRE